MFTLEMEKCYLLLSLVWCESIRALSKFTGVCYRNYSPLLPLPATCFIPYWLRFENIFHLHVHMKAEATYSGVAAVTNSILVMG